MLTGTDNVPIYAIILPNIYKPTRNVPVSMKKIGLSA